MPIVVAPVSRRIGIRDDRDVIAVVGSEANEATAELVADWRELGLDARLVGGADLARIHGAADVILGRLDVLETLDGVEPGLFELLRAERRGVKVLNCAAALLDVHDKLRTAVRLANVALPHPRTAHVRTVQVPPFEGPYVVKPRYGSWGCDVVRCEDADALVDRLESLRDRPWFRRHGALVQEAVPNEGRDLRIVVADGRVVGAAERLAAPGEWRTNVSCGGELRPTTIDDGIAELARTAAAAFGVDFVGVDVMPSRGRGPVVLELNGAVEFDAACALGGRSVAVAAAAALGLLSEPTPARSQRGRGSMRSRVVQRDALT